MPFPKGGHHSAETKARMSASRKGYTHSEETRAKIGASNSRRTLSIESRAKIAASLTGIKASVETREKQSASQRARWDAEHAANPGWEEHNREVKHKCNIAWQNRHPDFNRDQVKRNIIGHLFGGARRRANRLGREFSITREDIVIPLICPVLGIPLIIGATRDELRNAPSLDRIDNSKGYTPGNVVVVSHRANILKRDATLDEMRKLVAFYTALEDAAAKALALP